MVFIFLLHVPASLSYIDDTLEVLQAVRDVLLGIVGFNGDSDAGAVNSQVQLPKLLSGQGHCWLHICLWCHLETDTSALDVKLTRYRFIGPAWKMNEGTEETWRVNVSHPIIIDSAATCESAISWMESTAAKHQHVIISDLPFPGWVHVLNE